MSAQADYRTELEEMAALDRAKTAFFTSAATSFLILNICSYHILRHLSRAAHAVDLDPWAHLRACSIGGPPRWRLSKP
jgi:hypothetical protein